MIFRIHQSRIFQKIVIPHQPKNVAYINQGNSWVDDLYIRDCT